MSLSGGIYRIYQWRTSGQPQYLTDLDGIVTIAPEREVEFKSSQEWAVQTYPDGRVAIQHPARLFPSRSLSYEGEPELGKTIILSSPSDFPARFWNVEAALQKPLPIPFFIRVPNKDLMIELSRLTIYPPRLALALGNNDLHNAWAFEKVETS